MAYQTVKPAQEATSSYIQIEQLTASQIHFSVFMSLSSVLANKLFNAMIILGPSQNYSNKIGYRNFGFRLYLVVNNFNEGCLVVSRSFKAVEVHYGGGNIGEPRGLNIRPEFHARMKTRASNSNRNLQV